MRPPLTLGLVAALFTPAASATNTILDACSTLAASLGSRVAFPDSPSYEAGLSYWSARQAAQRPSCLVTPATAAEVALTLTTLVRAATPFTFCGGGHTAHANGSNTDGRGVTVSLARLRTLRLAPDRASVAVGAGLRWGDVSAALDPHGRAVLGGRDADVGVSGLLLGGGFSFFSGRYGWACDNVLGMEVVLASGEVVYASKDRHRGLFRALKGGGGSSFGVVTRFDLATIEQGDLWTRTVLFAGQAKDAIAAAATALMTTGMDEDPDAHAYFVRLHQPSYGGFINLASFFHAAPPPRLNATPAAFRAFDGIPGVLSNASMVGNLTAVTRSIANPYGLRQTWSNIAFAAGSPAVVAELLALWDAAVLAIVPQAAARGADYAPFAIYQAISAGHLRASHARGGNAMGLAPDMGPMVMMHFLTGWSDAALDEAVLEGTKALVRAAEAKTRARGVDRAFVYMNYAGEGQDVLRRYGLESYLRLLETSLRYDPRRDLQRLWRGYFKLY